MFLHAIFEVFLCYCYNCNLSWGVIPARNLKHRNSIQCSRSGINDAMMFFLYAYLWTWTPVFPLHFRAYVLHIAYLHFFPIFKLLHKGTVHYCKRWILNEKIIKILSLALTCCELWCFEATDPVFTGRCSKANMNQCKECLFS